MNKIQISEADKQEIDEYVDKMADSFMDLVQKLKELKINPNVEWIQSIHTILDSGVNGVNQLAFFDRDRSYGTWATRNLDVVENEKVIFSVNYLKKCDVQIEGTYNSASNRVNIPDCYEDDDEIISITFLRNGETLTVCNDCQDYVLTADGHCPWCGE